MTKEQKHDEVAEKFAESLGAAEGKSKSTWADEMKEEQRARIATLEAQRRECDSSTEGRAVDTLRAARYEARHAVEWAQNDERHAAYLAEVKDCCEHRRRNSDAYDRIAAALEALAGKKP